MTSEGVGLLEALRQRVPDEARAWLDECVEVARAPTLAGAPERFYEAFTSASRRFGRDADQLARRLLLQEAASSVSGAAYQRLVEDCFRYGETRERQAVLRALPHLPQPGRFAALAVEACRTNVIPIFEAIACENPYPAKHFPPQSFNQMVLKALFVGVSVERIEGLDDRWTEELARMAADYARERELAGRPVPADVHLLTRRDGRPA